MFLKEASFRFKNAGNGETKPYDSKSLEITNKTRKALLTVWNGYGKRIDISTLNRYGWNLEYVPAQSQEYYDYYRCVYMFQHHPNLIGKVKALKEVYDAAGLKYDATEYETEERVLELENPGEWPQKFSVNAEELAIELTVAYRDYLVNVEKDYDHNPVGTWSVYCELPTLIKWMPNNYTTADIPEFKEPINVISEDIFKSLNGGKSDTE